jgi:hypothetical protein
MKNTGYRWLRRTQGSAFVELAATAWMFVVFAYIAVDIGILVWGAWINDTACREAARAASQQNNDNDAKVAAARAVAAFATASNLVTSPKCWFTAGNWEFEPRLDANGTPQIKLGPYVKCTTRLDMTLPVPIVFGETGFTKYLIFKQSYCFPILNPSQLYKGAPQLPSSVYEDELAQQMAKEASEH